MGMQWEDEAVVCLYTRHRLIPVIKLMGELIDFECSTILSDSFVTIVFNHEDVLTFRQVYYSRFDVHWFYW